MGLPVCLGAAGRWRGRLVVVSTGAGRLRCRGPVLTVPPALLAARAIRFRPALPNAKLVAAAGLPGHVTKLYLGVDGDPFGLGPDRQAVGSLQRARTALYHLNPLGRPLVEAYWGGPVALELEQAGPAALAGFALPELAELFGTKCAPTRAAARGFGVGG